MTAFLPSPGTAAKVLAARQPDLKGELRIASLTPGGRGGWKIKTKVSHFWMDGGKAWQKRDMHTVFPPWYQAENGPCRVCGSYFVKSEVVRAFFPDPEVGKIVGATPAAGLGIPGIPITNAPLAEVRACPTCVEAHGLLPPPDRLMGFFWLEPQFSEGRQASSIYRRVRHHPTLWRYDPPIFTADIRRVQEGREELDAVTIAPYGGQDG